MSHTLFITGTDTHVGKTIITAALGVYYREQGLKVAVCKPFESGEPLHSDSCFLKETIPLDQSIDDINLYRFKAPLAPGIAAEQEGRAIDIARVVAHIQNLEQTHDVVLIEGAGGLMVPLAPHGQSYYLVIDLIAALQAPTLIVARAGLGTINHSLLTLSTLNHHHLPIVGLVLNQGMAAIDASQASNTDSLHRLLPNIPIFGPIPTLSTLSHSTLLPFGRDICDGLHLPIPARPSIG